MFNKFKSSISTLIIVLFALGLAACSSMAPAPAAKRVFFVEPADGATVGTKFKVKFGVAGMEVKPAGDETANSGHHHVLVNLDSINAGETIPFTEKHIHFGKGQTEAELTLAPGRYKLTMQFADKNHNSYGKAMSQTITVIVQ
jgi:Domain of unknown function (DUF4399)